MRSLAVVLLSVVFASAGFAGTIGTVIPVVGQVTGMVHDPARGVVYLANPLRNQVDIYSVSLRRLNGSITAGLQPGSLALSPDGNTLYVANLGSLSVSAINLSNQLSNEYLLGSRPDAIAVGNDGVIVILGSAGLLYLDPIGGRVTAVPISPPATPPVGVNVIASATPANFIAGLVPTAYGSLMIGLSTNRLFVYEVASRTVLRSRNVTGLRAILSASPDGSRFMAGPFLFDTQTLTILGRAGTVSPTLTGGSAFSVDGNTVYATFSTQPAINPLNTNNPQNAAGLTPPAGVPSTAGQSVLQLMRSSSLTPQLGLRIPEPITSRIISSADGQNLFATSTSGLLVIPIGQLGNLPVLDVSSANVVLSVDPCNQTLATATIQVRNLGANRMTFAATLNNQAAPVQLTGRTGVAPSTLTITFDPRTLTTRGTQQYAVILTSPEAINVEPAILVNLSFRDITDRGMVVPMTGVGVDIQMDAARRLLYIANYTQDQVEVFSLTSQTFLPPIRVGNRPISMALANPSTLVVANAGGENISVVDLDLMEEVDQISMGPIPLNATPLFPRSIAASSNAILFSAVPLPVTAGLAPGNGSIWQASILTRSAFPKLDLGAAIATQGRNLLSASSSGSGILVADGNGTVRLYDPLSDSIVVTRTATVPQPLRGTATSTADGSFFIVDNIVMNSVLTPVGTLATAGVGIGGAQSALALGVVSSGNSVIRVQNTTALSPVQSLQRYNLATLQTDFQASLAEQVMDITPLATGIGTRLWPPRAAALEIGVNNQTQLLPRGIAVDGTNTYIMTVSGLSIVSLTSNSGRVPAFASSGVVNTATRRTPVSAGTLISILGTNLADTDTALSAPLPRSLGGVCVTANEVSIPLIATSPTKIDAQLPPELANSRSVTLRIRSTRLGVASNGVSVPLQPASPGVFSMELDDQPRAMLYHAVDGALVTPVYPAERDEHLFLYATGLGPVSPRVAAGEATPAEPSSPTDETIHVSIGGVPYWVLWSGLAPGYIGVYAIELYVPGDHVSGDELPVVITSSGVSSPASTAPLAAVQ
jgi:uncharacterized protein (TIGR03437 family)